MPEITEMIELGADAAFGLLAENQSERATLEVIRDRSMAALAVRYPSL